MMDDDVDVSILKSMVRSRDREITQLKQQLASLRKAAVRYDWLLQHAKFTARDDDGEEVAYFLHFDDTEDGESISEAIDRHIASGSKDAVS